MKIYRKRENWAFKNRKKNKSELWKTFQDSRLRYNWFSNSTLSDDNFSHLSLHAVKPYGNGEGLEQEEEHSSSSVRGFSSTHGSQLNTEIDRSPKQKDKIVMEVALPTSSKQKLRSHKNEGEAPPQTKKEDKVQKPEENNQQTESEGDLYRFTDLMDEL
jgi:hypothetical protein